MVRRPCVRCPSVHHFQRSSSPKTAGPIKAKFHIEPQWDGGTKVYSRGLSHMTKMAATPIYGKNLSKIFYSRTRGPLPWGYIHVKKKHKKLCIKSDFKDIFWKLATNGKSDKAFLLTSGFCPQRVVCTCPGAIYLWKNITKCV